MRKDNSEYKALRITLTLNKRTLDIIDEVASSTCGSKSSAVRFMVSEYAKSRDKERKE